MTWITCSSHVTETMSLTQRAKKKLIGSFSKKKKGRLVSGHVDETLLPPPLPKSRPPLPDFRLLEEEKGKKLQPSTSMPDLWNDTFRPELTTPLSMSATSLVHPRDHPRRYSEDEEEEVTAQMPPIEEIRHRSASLDDVHLQQQLSPKAFKGSLQDLNHDLALPLRDIVNSLGHVKDRGRASRNKNSHSLDGTGVKNFVADKTSKLRNIFRSRSFSLPSSNNLGNPSISASSDLSTSTNGSVGCSSNTEDVTSRERDEQTLETPEEDNVFDDVSNIPCAILNATVSLDRYELTSLSTDSQGVQFNGLSTNDALGNSPPAEIMNSNGSIHALSRIPRMDSSVLKKVQFFENIAESGQLEEFDESDADIQNTPTTNSTSQQNISSPHNLSRSAGGYGGRHTLVTTKTPPEAPPRPLSRSTSSFNVFPRVFTDHSAGSQRLNFNKFKRSQSIPEASVLCYCGRGCESNCFNDKDLQHFLNEPQGCLHEGSNQQVCHHPQCMEDNNDRPLQLCRACELTIHRQVEFSGHLVLDIQKKRSTGVKSSVGKAENDSDSDYLETQISLSEDQVDGLYVKNNSKYRNKSPSEVEKKLQRKKALRKKNTNDGLEAALAQIADPENSDSPPVSRMDSATDLRSTKDILSRRDSGQGDWSVIGVSSELLESQAENLSAGAGSGRSRVRRQNRVTGSEYITLKFGRVGEDSEVVAATECSTLRDTIAPFLERRSLDVSCVNVFVDKSKTPLPMECDISHLKGTTLEIKEKTDAKDSDQGGQNKKSNSTKSNSGKNNKQSGRSSRRDSVGVVPLLLEPPPNKQRRGSLQLPFREHFFNKGDSKSTDALKVYDDSFGSLRGRDKYSKLSIDDTFYPPTSPSGTLTEGKKSKSQKLSVVNLFNSTNSKDRERQDQLNEILNRYSTSGLPPLPALLAIDRPNFDENMFALELNWRLLVDGDESLPKTQQEHQEAVWELLHTEVSYIKQIRVIIDVFRNCLINIQNEGFLNDIETERLFSNIDKIYECNCTFWQKYLLPVLIISREYKKPLDPLICKNGFVEHFPQLFEVYFKYFIEHKACLDYAKSCMENSDLFKSFIMWAEAQKPCNRLKMADILVKPMQRLLKYSLLLQAILKHTEHENEKAEIKEMIQSVDKLCSAANNSLQRREEYEKLEAVRNIIDPFDSIEAPNDECAKIIQEYSNNFSLLAPITGFRESFHRDLLFQASLKMKDTQKSEAVECFLFTDLILICKSKKSDKYKMIKPPMRLDQIVVSDLKDKGSFLLIYMNEYRVPTSACTFHSDVGAIKVFLDKFRDAQKKFKNRKLQDTLISERKVTGSVTTEDNDITTLSAVPSDQNIASFPRSESVDSADQFLPNLTTPGDLTSEMVLGLGHSGSTGDIQSRSNLLGHKDLIHINTDPKMSSSTDSFLCEVYADGSSLNVSSKHRQVTSCRSFPNITVSQSNNSSDSSSQKTINDGGICNDSESVHSLQCSLTSNSAAQLSEQCSADFDLSKQKLNARRVSRTEKRYLTADSIQELKNAEKDSTIHKRLSWRTDLDQSRNIGSKVLSTDSIGSFPSSSGVSSTASLHLNPESDITEEIECNSGGHKIFSVGGADDLDNGDDYTDDEMSSQSKSRNTPDIITKVNSLYVSEMKDGIASVAVDSIQHKLTPADIMKFKKLKHQVLDDANIESSEV